MHEIIDPFTKNIFGHFQHIEHRKLEGVADPRTKVQFEGQNKKKKKVQFEGTGAAYVFQMLM